MGLQRIWLNYDLCYGGFPNQFVSMLFFFMRLFVYMLLGLAKKLDQFEVILWVPTMEFGST